MLTLPLLFTFEHFSSDKKLGVALLPAAVDILAFDVRMDATMRFVNFVLMSPHRGRLLVRRADSTDTWVATAYPVILR